VSGNRRKIAQWEHLASGRIRVRVRHGGGKRITLGTVDTEAEAAELVRAYQSTALSGPQIRGVSLAQWGLGVLDQREPTTRGISKERSKWKSHVEGDALGALSVATVTRVDVVAWLERMRVKGRAVSTRESTLSLLRVVLRAAADAGLLKSNPAADVRVPRREKVTKRAAMDAILTRPEQLALLAVVPDSHPWQGGKRPADWREMVAVALYTGVRRGELFALRWGDVGADSITVRSSVGGKGTKGGAPRVIPLLPPVRDALATLRGRRGRLEGGDLVFLSVTQRKGGRVERTPYCATYRPRSWHDWITKAGVTRRIRFQDLRHTAATSLLAGWWGHRWPIESVSAYLGHSSIGVTQRYARILSLDLVADAGATLAPDARRKRNKKAA
jgi:integrase